MTDTTPNYLIEVDELQELLEHPDLRLFDATVLFTPDEDGALAASSGFDAYTTARIPGAGFFDHLGHFADADSPLRNTLLGIDELHKAIGAAGIGADHQVVLYSSQFLMWSTRAWWMLHYAGHNNVRVLNGGLAAWQSAGLAIETGSHSYPPTAFEATVRPQRYASKQTIACVSNNKEQRRQCERLL